MNKFATLWNLGNDALGMIRKNNPQLNDQKAAKALQTYNLKSGKAAIAYFPEVGMIGTALAYPNYDDVIKMAKRTGMEVSGYGFEPVRFLVSGGEKVAALGNALGSGFCASKDPELFQEICSRVIDGLRTEGEECKYYGPSYNRCSGYSKREKREKLCLREAGKGCEGKKMLDEANEEGRSMIIRPTASGWDCRG
jgi:hypothetical protein